MTTKEILAHLSNQGVFVKSGSSTVEAPVARRLRVAFADGRASRGRVSDRRAAGKNSTRQSDAKDARAARPRRLAGPQASRLYKDYREAFVSQNPNREIQNVYLKYERIYRISRATLEALIAVDRQTHAADYAALSNARDQRRQARRQRDQGRLAPGKRVSAPGRDSAASPFVGTKAATLPRDRHAGLPTIQTVTHLDAVAGIIETLGGDFGENIADRLQVFSVDEAGSYGYLAWRYAAAYQPHSTSTLVINQLAAIAHVVETERQLLDRLISDVGAVLDHPSLATRAIENEYRDLVDSDDIGRSAADEVRHVRAMHRFLRRTLVLVIATPDQDERLWAMLGQLKPPAREQLAEVTPQLATAIDRLKAQIASIGALLAADETALRDFFSRSRSELTALYAGRFDFLRTYHDVGASAPKPAHLKIHGVPFAVLPPGEQLRSFLNGLRSSGLYRGHRVDVNRLSVLEDLEAHFGADVCSWYEGSQSSEGVNNEYLVLATRSAEQSGEDAVAISPLAGEHATYVVRGDCAKAHWAKIFAIPKLEARERGARKLLFTSPHRRVDQYTAMRKKIIALLECPL